ncbi:peptidoglycan-binding domain-containing protein [Kumtagia ephedrae]|uniref:Peptidoglycan-binding protein n=1 Tax=Kumtagia ephedrae TaxID=2116701 RepID=A0A2P7RLJ0_9HYPH|nr:peptidoglycan-binding protein [Mesorhizobium ephedrae]PSJ51082.1 peptidoglycan-binding protein [Mesorhizobium ephedrae]
MARSARQAKRPAARPRFGGVSAVGALIARNPVVAGGSTAFLVALFYVSANAIWYQPHIHRGAFFPTRDFVRSAEVPVPEPETTFVIERPAEASSRPSPAMETTTAKVQGVLKELGFYSGAVDGLSGPATSRAIEAYRAKVGLTVSDAIDEDLLTQLGLEPTTAGIRPSPAPRAAEPPRTDHAALTKKVQAGLKAFGNDGIDLDGIPGARTKAAIREFQSIFGLPVTGEPDETVHAKMREIGLVGE